MKNYLVLMGAAAALLLASACSIAPGGTGSTPPLTAGSSAAAGNEPSPGAKCTPVAGGIPTTVKDFNCLNLASVSGSDSTGDLAWLGTDPFTVVTMVRDGVLSFASKTPCNTLMSSVKVTDTQFIVEPNMSMTQMGCQSPRSDYEGWVAKFFSTPLEYKLNKDSLELSNSHGTVVLKAVKS